MTSIPIGPGTRVGLTFTLKLAGGEVVDGTNDRIASFVVGDGSLLPGFEAALFGMKKGETANLHIGAEQGFGAPNPDNVQMMKRSDFARDIELEEGLVVSFADPDQAELPGVVKRVLDELVEIDFNHPLAGKDLEFDVEIHEVEQVSNEIARGG